MSEPASAAAIASVGRDNVSIGDVVSLEGAGLLPLRSTFSVEIGGVPAFTEAWNDDSIDVRMPAVDPGRHEVRLVPNAGNFRVALNAGSVVVSKINAVPPEFASVPDEILVRLAPDVLPAAVALSDDVFRRLLPLVNDPLLSRWYAVGVPADQEGARLTAYAALDAVEVVEQEPVGSSDRAPSDPQYTNSAQFNVRTTRMTAAWEVRQTATNHPIAILDTGINAGHQDFPATTLLHNQDMTGTGVGPCDDHGSNVASIAGAAANNGVGTAGGSWGGPIGMYKVLGTGANCTGTMAQLIQGIDRAFHDGFWVISMSLSFPTDSVALQNIVNAAWNAGRFLVAAAGNDNSANQRFPAADNNVFAVANSRADDTRSPTSNFGNWVDLAAPGENIVGAGNCSATCVSTFSGTSQATPLVSAAAALLMESGVPNVNIAALLQATANAVNFGANAIAGGRLNAYRAITSRSCLRDLPAGAAYSSTTGGIFVVDNPSKRGFPDPATYNSWYGNEAAPTCDLRLNEISNGATAGFRPGTLVQSPGGTIFLVTGDGNDIMRSPIRGFTSQAVFNCFGFNGFPIVTASAADIALHAQGAVISSCTPGLRVHPNGSILRNAAGTIFFVQAGKLRGFPSANVLASWKFTNSIPISLVESLLYTAGANMGYRPGTRISANGAVWSIGINNGVDKYAAPRRAFATPNAIVERGMAGTQYNGTTAELAVNPVGVGVLDADGMP